MTQLLAQINPGDVSLAGFVPQEGRNTMPVKKKILKSQLWYPHALKEIYWVEKVKAVVGF